MKCPVEPEGECYREMCGVYGCLKEACEVVQLLAEIEELKADRAHLIMERNHNGEIAQRREKGEQVRYRERNVCLNLLWDVQSYLTTIMDEVQPDGGLTKETEAIHSRVCQTLRQMDWSQHDTRMFRQPKEEGK